LGNGTPAFRIHDGATGKPVASVGLAAQWSRPAFAPGGKLVALPPGLGNGAGAVMSIRDVETGTEVAAVTDPDYAVGAAAFAPDGRTLASICGKPQEGIDTVAVWAAATGKLVRRITGVELTASCLAYAPRGKPLAL